MKKYKVIVLGSTGMLGHAVVTRLREFYGEDQVASTSRNSLCDEIEPYNFFFDTATRQNPSIVSTAEYVINCIGVIKPRIDDANLKTVAEAIHTNSAFPVRLAEFCERVGSKLIHITTDCVFNGDDGGYKEIAFHDCTDVYGKSKSLGEACRENAMVLRTSIIGTEPNNQSSLVEWVRSQDGKAIKGFTNHFWNGITSTEFAEVCRRIIEGAEWRKGLYHVFSPAQVSKYELVKMIAHRLGLGIGIVSDTGDVDCDRTLATIYPELTELWGVGLLSQQIQDMPDFNPPDDEAR